MREINAFYESRSSRKNSNGFRESGVLSVEGLLLKQIHKNVWVQGSLSFQHSKECTLMPTYIFYEL
jgi:hypothetical protein